MKIALTGSSSSGKTTLVKALRNNPVFISKVPHYVHVDARALLREMNHASMDKMTVEELRQFQKKYFKEKVDREKDGDFYITERSYVDIAAYWMIRDAIDYVGPDNNIIDKCKILSKSYSLHIYLPFGIVPFTSDGYRSENVELHKSIDKKIEDLLIKWELKFLRLNTAHVSYRVSTVLKYIASLA